MLLQLHLWHLLLQLVMLLSVVGVPFARASSKLRLLLQLLLLLLLLM